MHHHRPSRTRADSFLRAAIRCGRHTLLLAIALVVLPAAARASGPDAEATQASAVEAVASEAPAAPPASRRPREFVGFATDAAVARGLWAELGETYLQDTHGS